MQLKTAPVLTDQFLLGGGEMGALMRLQDWNNSLLGDTSQWPQSLRTTLSIILHSKFPMFLYWGPGLVCFYNDAYRPSLGNNGKHPYILGKAAEEAWPEIWHIIKPLIDQVLAGGEATWSNDQLIPIFRNGKLEDVYWTFSYSAVSGGAGHVDGVLVTCQETTEQVNKLKEIKNSEYQLAFTLDAAELGTWDLNPVTNKFVGNNRLKEWFGLPAAAEIELPMALDVILEKDRQRVVNAIQTALQSPNENYEIEYTITNPLTKQQRNVLAKGKALFGKDGRPYKFSGILQDITEQLKARKKIEDNAQRFRNLVEQAPVATCVYVGREMKIELANDEMLKIWGKEKNVIGRSLMDAIPELKGQPFHQLLNEVYTTGKSFKGSEIRADLKIDNTLQTFYFDFTYKPLQNTEGEITGILNTALDVTSLVIERKKVAESEKRFRDTVRQAPVGMLILRGENLVVEMANESYLQLVDRKEDEFVGKPILESLPEVKEAVGTILHDVLHSGFPFYGNEFEIPINRFGKKEKAFFNFVYHPLKEIDGSVSGVIAIAYDVTKQVEARFRLEESENQFRNLVTSSPIGMAVIREADFVIEMANEALLNTLWHKKLGEVQGKRLLEIFPELEGQQFPQLLKMVFDTGIPYKANEAVAYVGEGIDKIKYYLDFEYSPLFGKDKIVSGIMVTAIDMTETVEARKTIENAEERARLAIDAGDLGTFELNLATDKIICSRRFNEIFGLQGSNSHKEYLNLVHPMDNAIKNRAHAVAKQTGSLTYEARIIWKDESIHWIRIDGKTLYDKNGDPGRLLGTVKDITEQKEREIELQLISERFRLLADSMPQQVWTSDQKGNLNYFNQSVFNFSGLTLEELTQNGWLQIVHPDDQTENIQRWVEAVKTGKDFLFEHRFRRYDGEYRWQLSRAVPQKDTTGNIQLWVGTSTDIHDQKTFAQDLEEKVLQRTEALNQSAKDLEELNAELVKSNAELAQFAYVASHDLQEPLRKIQTFATRIISTESENLSERGMDYFSRMQASALRMQQLIKDLLSFSRTNTSEKYFEKTDLNIVFQTVKEQLKENIQQKNALVSATLLPTLEIIPYQFEQLFTNIITNALKFSKKDNDPVIHISAGLVDAKNIENHITDGIGQFHHIAISDNGIGFEPQFGDRIFKMFQRLHGKHEYEGTGIGLAIVKKIVENHHGHINATSELNKGATFNIYIPFLT